MTSPIDRIFEKIFGYTPAKNGTAYELLSAIASFALQEGVVCHDKRIRGAFSETLYQIDVYHETSNATSIGEAKDYTQQGVKVGRDDLQKLAGALPDIEKATAGIFFSATGYTKPAQKYASASSNLTGGKQISLYEFRPSTELDEKGFIKTIVINLHISIPDLSSANFLPIITKNGNEALMALLKNGEDQIQTQERVEFFYDEKGNQINSVAEITSNGYGDINTDTGKSHGCFVLKNNFIKISDVLAELHGLQYDIPYSYELRTIKITDDSEHRFAILDSKGTTLKILRDAELRKFSFDEDGNLISPAC